MSTPPGPELLGTRLRHLLDLLDGELAACYPALGLDDGFRPRFTPVVRVLAAGGPASIRELAGALGVTHSAASQTVAQMARQELVTLTPGADARRRIVRLAPRAESLLPALEREWAATTAAATAFEAELPYPLSRLIGEALAALERRPMRDRIGEAVQAAGDQEQQDGPQQDGPQRAGAPQAGSPQAGQPRAEQPEAP
ncbi:MarR family winged helix-turn-helix transcriptional regulator [Streptomyces sp. CA-111067]|uniref:MarR family winged helix-turn-helix transcriptional regulator n=1 Tax=Streptomyces sp. CA-111067 TaxID=3240046 RepID=UPI003D962371